MGSLICFVLPALMTITVTTVAQTRQKYQAQVSSQSRMVVTCLQSIVCKNVANICKCAC